MKKSERHSSDGLTTKLTYLSLIVSGKLIFIKITPNQVTVGRFIFLVIPASLLIMFGGYIEGLFVLFLLLLNHFFDMVDGDMARNYQKSSALGKFLDENLDLVSLDIIYLSISINLFIHNHPLKYFGLLIIFILVIGVRLTDIIRERFGIVSNKSTTKFKNRLHNNLDLFSIISLQFLHPTNQLTHLLLDFKYYFITGLILNILPIMIAIYFFIVLFGATLLFLLICIYDSNSKLRNKLLIIDILKSLEAKRTNEKK